jgi:hypothetical protein
MITRNPVDLEKSLERLMPMAIPPGLRERVMASAIESRENAVLTPRLRATALVWAVLALVAVIGDAVISKWQSGRIAALLGGPNISTPAGAEDEGHRLWADFGGELGDLDKFRMAGIALSRLGNRGGDREAFLETRDYLKGMIDYEDPEKYY